MASLKRAAVAGWRDAAMLKSEAIYEPIRGRPDYPALLAAVEGHRGLGPRSPPPPRRKS